MPTRSPPRDGPLIQPADLFASYPTIITLDPPEQNKRRKLISSAFTPRAIAKLEDGIRARASRMIDDLLAAGGGDWIDDVADALPDDRHRRHHRHSGTGPAAYLRRLRPHPEGSVARRATASMDTDLFATIFGYAMELTAEKRRNPADDIWSTLASGVITGDDGEQFSLAANELEFFFFVLAFAGSDTTKNALAIGLQAFVANPDQIERYRDDESAAAQRRRGGAAVGVAGGVLDAHHQGRRRNGRSAHPQGRAGGVDAALGEPRRRGLRVAVHLRHRRQPNPHVAFGGGGAHHCLGAMLARAEIRAVLDELLLRCDSITLGPAEVAYPNLTTNMSIYDEMADHR